MTLRPKFLLALAALVTLAGAYVLWCEWENAACPGEAEVREFGQQHGMGFWPATEKRLDLHVGEWLFFAREPVQPSDRVVYKTKGSGKNGVIFPGTVVSARPMTAMARLRLWYREVVHGRHEGYKFQWTSPD